MNKKDKLLFQQYADEYFAGDKTHEYEFFQKIHFVCLYTITLYTIPYGYKDDAIACCHQALHKALKEYDPTRERRAYFFPFLLQILKWSLQTWLLKQKLYFSRFLPVEIGINDKEEDMENAKLSVKNKLAVDTDLYRYFYEEEELKSIDNMVKKMLRGKGKNKYYKYYKLYTKGYSSGQIAKKLKIGFKSADNSVQRMIRILRSDENKVEYQKIYKVLKDNKSAYPTYL